MAKAKKENIAAAELQRLEQIKKLAIVAMFSDDQLMDHLVLKGGNAIDLIHQIGARASVDVDFSMGTDFPGGLENFKTRVEEALRTTFRAEGYEAFDVNMEERPQIVSEDMSTFWGGYGVDFKLIDPAKFKEYEGNMEQLRRNAISLGLSTKFLIDISRFEYVSGKQPFDLDGYRIFVYSPEMIVCEKLRAICQQMPEYGPVVKRDRAGAPRARDFLDIHSLVNFFLIDISLPKNREILSEMFRAKRVPLSLLGRIDSQREFHRANFPAVVDTVKADFKLLEFDVYFDFVLSLAEKLNALWDV